MLLHGRGYDDEVAAAGAARPGRPCEPRGAGDLRCRQAGQGARAARPGHAPACRADRPRAPGTGGALSEEPRDA
jgi:hypothetical protein